jgi:hypothetical protein
MIFRLIIFAFVILFIKANKKGRDPQTSPSHYYYIMEILITNFLLALLESLEFLEFLASLLELSHP